MGTIGVPVAAPCSNRAMEALNHTLLIAGLLLFAAIALSAFSTRIGVPSLLVFLGVGLFATELPGAAWGEGRLEDRCAGRQSRARGDSARRRPAHAGRDLSHGCASGADPGHPRRGADGGDGRRGGCRAARSGLALRLAAGCHRRIDRRRGGVRTARQQWRAFERTCRVDAGSRVRPQRSDGSVPDARHDRVDPGTRAFDHRSAGDVPAAAGCWPGRRCTARVSALDRGLQGAPARVAVCAADPVGRAR